MSQNIGRLPILGSTTRSWSVAENPFGDHECVSGFYAACFDPVTSEHTIESDGFETAVDAWLWIDSLLEQEAAS